jgi:hypothetical protein
MVVQPTGDLKMKTIAQNQGLRLLAVIPCWMAVLLAIDYVLKLLS